MAQITPCLNDFSIFLSGVHSAFIPWNSRPIKWVVDSNSWRFHLWCQRYWNAALSPNRYCHIAKLSRDSKLWMDCNFKPKQSYVHIQYRGAHFPFILDFLYLLKLSEAYVPEINLAQLYDFIPRLPLPLRLQHFTTTLQDPLWVINSVPACQSSTKYLSLALLNMVCTLSVAFTTHAWSVSSILCIVNFSHTKNWHTPGSSGRVYVFPISASDLFTPTQIIDSSGASFQSQFGQSVAFNGLNILIGAPGVKEGG